MSLIRLLHEIRLGDKDQVGEKAAHLGELIYAGFDVPHGICITADAYRAILAENRIDAQIPARLAATDIDDPVELEEAAEEIRAWIENAAMPANLVQELVGQDASASQVPPLSYKPYAVRVSRIVEDVVNPRASGLAQAFLGVLGTDAVLAHVHKCWATPWTSRAIYYRHRKKMGQQVAVAVVVQPMVAADAAGVMFTANPLTMAEDEIHIDATWGLGEPVIAARWQPDRFVVRNSDMAIHTRDVASKQVMEIGAKDGGLETLSVPPEKQTLACLSDEQAVALAELGIQAQAHFGRPQDIEWCRVGDRFTIVQTRALYGTMQVPRVTT
ncbi:MAG: hypothetical protein HY782_18870 [Chloroflexi bacterium]|nr:hypothetical protein [Chloroflexota bacterium]